MTAAGEIEYFSRALPDETPSEWEVCKLSVVCSLKNGDSLPTENREGGSVPVFGSNGVVGNHTETNTSAPMITVGRKGSAGEVNFSEEAGFVIDTAYYIDQKNLDCDIRWLYYLLRSLNLKQNTEHSAVPGINRRFIEEHRIALPSRKTQEDIAAFLQAEESQIESSINTLVHLRNLIEQRERSLTEELISDCSSTDDVKLKYVTNMLSGYAFSSDHFSGSSEGIPLLRGINIGVGETSWEDTVYWTSDLDEYSNYLVEPDDIVLAMDRPWVSDGMRIAQLEKDDCPALLVQRVLRIRTSEEVLQEYVRIALESVRFKQYFDPILTGVSVPHISKSQVGEYRIPLPSIKEQKSIISEWEEFNSTKEELESKINNLIDTLEENRQALITAAVTGQIDVSEEKGVIQGDD